MRAIDADFMEKHYALMLLNPTPDVTKNDMRKARIIIDALRMEKTIEAVEVVHGEWIDKGRHLWECSNCKMIIYSESEQDRSEFHKWCSRCGARMKGADDECGF